MRKQRASWRRGTLNVGQVAGVFVCFAAFLSCLLLDSVAAQEQDRVGVKNSTDDAEMILIPAGTFFMGSSSDEVDAQFLDTKLPEDWKKYTADEQPRHEREVRAFYIYKYEVTNAQYKMFVDATGHRSPPHWSGTTYPEGKDKHPVVEVSWDDAQAYCRWAGTRLPTEAEWEYAARGDGGAGEASLAFPWGDAWDRTVCNNSSFHAGKEITSADDWNAWYKGVEASSFPLTTPVGLFSKSASPFGVEDMAGNAWEWCADIQAPYPEQRANDADNQKLRARRGGSWANVALHIRSADRQPAAHDNVNLYTGFRCVKPVIEQAGDLFVEFVLNEIEAARHQLPVMTQAAELAAQRIVDRKGELLSAGDQSFALEPVWRAGGIAFARQYQPDKESAGFSQLESTGDEVPYYRTKEFVEHFTVQKASKDDVVLLGFENEKEEQRHLTSTVEELLSAEALVVFFGSSLAAAELQAKFGARDNLVIVSHHVPDGGIVEVSGWPEKICSGRSIANRLYLWAFQAELISAFMRRGKIPGILLSVTYESPQIWNLPLLHSYRFVPAFDVTPVKEGVFGNTYLDHLRRIVGSIVPAQRRQFRQAATWLADAVRSKATAFALLIHGLDPEGLPGDPGFFKVYSEGNAYYPQLDGEMKKGDVALFVGYNWYPRRLAETVDRAEGKQILCFTLVQDVPPVPAVYGEVGELFHPTSFDQVPQGDNRIYIDLKFAQYNAVLKIPDYPIPALETSSFAEDVVYWHLVADVAEILAKDSK